MIDIEHNFEIRRGPNVKTIEGIKQPIFVNPELETLFTLVGADAYEAWGNLEIEKVKALFEKEAEMVKKPEVSFVSVKETFSTRLAKVIRHYEQVQDMAMVFKLRNLLEEISSLQP